MDAIAGDGHSLAVQPDRRPRLALLFVLTFAVGTAGCAGEPVQLLTRDGPVAAPLPPGSLPRVGCYANFALGELVVDPVNGTAIVDMGTVAVMWPAGYTGRQAGSEVEVLDPQGQVVAVTGHRYQIEGGTPPDAPHAFLACGYVLPK